MATTVPARSRPPAPAPVGSFRFPSFTSNRLNSGLRLLVARRAGTPLVDLQLAFPAGAQQEARAEHGLASFTAALLDEGTRRHSAVEIAAALEGLGGYLATGAGWSSAYAGVGLLARHLDAGLDLLCEVVSEPTFPAAEVERLRPRRLADLRQRRDDPATLAADALARALYGDGPYGYPVNGDAKVVAELGAHDFTTFHRRGFTATGAFAVAAGDVEAEDLERRLSVRLDELPRGAAAPPTPIVPVPRADVEVFLVDRPQAPQTELRIGHASVPRSHPDRVALRVLNAILGGKFTSRLNLNLRERHGFTYGAHSRFIERPGPGPFVVSTAVANDAVGIATREVLGELERIRQEPVAAAELDDARSYLLGVFPYTLQTLRGLVARLEEIAVYDLPLDHFATYPEALRAVTRPELRRVAETHLEPERIVVVAVGPATLLRPQLEVLGRLAVGAA